MSVRSFGGRDVLRAPAGRQQRLHRAVFETLEHRRLLAADPLNLRALPVNTWGYADLTWEGAYDLDVTMHIEFSTNGQAFSESGTTYAAYHWGTVGGLSTSSTYWFRVRAEDPEEGWTNYSNVYRLHPPAVGSNVLVNDPNADANANDTQSETSMVVFGNTIIVGYNDSGSADAGDHFTGWSRSTNGGASFTDMGTLPDATPGDAGDPVLARDNTTGTIYFSTLSSSLDRIQVYRSTDNGATWSSPVNGTPGFAFPVHDKEWMAVDNFTGTGRGNVYLAFREFGGNEGMYLTRSTNGGATWGPDGGVLVADASTGNVQGAQVVVGPNHHVYVFWFDDTAANQRIMMRRSTDLGLTFGTPVVVADLSTTGVNGNLGFGFRSNAFPAVAVNPVSGNLYVAYADDPAGDDRANVYLRQSTDGGTSWSGAMTVNDDAASNDQWQPTISVNPAGTKLFIGFYDRRNDSANNLMDAYAGVARVWGNNLYWKPNIRMTTESFKPVFGVDPFINPTYMGDYDSSSADSTYFYYSWGDNRDDSLAREGEQANVRFAKVLIPNTAVPQTPTNLAATPVNNSGNSTLSWNGSFGTNPNDIVHIERSLNNSTWTEVGTAVAANRSTVVGGLDRFTTYYFRIRAENENGFSGYSNTFQLQGQVPDTPTGLTVDPVDPSGRAVLHWNGTGYRTTPYYDVMHMEYSTDGSNFTEAGTTIAAYHSGDIYNLSQNVDYWFRIRASNPNGHSAYSDVFFLDGDQNGNTQTPTNLAAAPITSSGTSELSWDGSWSTDAILHIEVSTDGVNYTYNGWTYAAYHWGIAQGLTQGQQYFIRVYVTDEFGTSGFSNVAITS